VGIFKKSPFRRSIEERGGSLEGVAGDIFISKPFIPKQY
jgi:hypothetical protein